MYHHTQAKAHQVCEKVKTCRTWAPISGNATLRVASYPFGPVIKVCMPGLTSKESSLTNTSLLGVIIGHCVVSKCFFRQCKSLPPFGMIQYQPPWQNLVFFQFFQTYHIEKQKCCYRHWPMTLLCNNIAIALRIRFCSRRSSWRHWKHGSYLPLLKCMNVECAKSRGDIPT